MTSGTVSIGQAICNEIQKLNTEVFRILDVYETREFEMPKGMKDYYNIRFLIGYIRDKEGLNRRKAYYSINCAQNESAFYPNIEKEIFGIAGTPVQLSDMISDLAKDLSKGISIYKKGRKYAKRYVPFQNAPDRV